MPGPQCAEKNQYQDSRTGGRIETGVVLFLGKREIMVDRLYAANFPRHSYTIL